MIGVELKQAMRTGSSFAGLSLTGQGVTRDNWRRCLGTDNRRIDLAVRAVSPGGPSRVNEANGIEGIPKVLNHEE